jgi:hypothetical protein
MFGRQLGWIMVGVLGGCPPSGPIAIDVVDTDAIPVPGGGDTDDTDSLEESDVPEIPLPMVEPDVIILLATFGYDAGTGEAVPYVNGTRTFQPELTVAVAETTWSGNFAERDGYCRVVQVLEEPATASPLFDPFNDVLFGFEWPQDTPVSGDCDTRLDPLWGDFHAMVEDWVWGVALKPELEEGYRESLLAAGTFSEEDLTRVIGGGFAGTLASGISANGFFEVATTQGLRMNSAHELELDSNNGPIAMSADEMVVDGELQTGRYFIQITLQWSAVSRVP